MGSYKYKSYFAQLVTFSHSMLPNRTKINSFPITCAFDRASLTFIIRNIATLVTARTTYALS
jgi:hypothetical protein